jgi:hypothetical protein
MAVLVNIVTDGAALWVWPLLVCLALLTATIAVRRDRVDMQRRTDASQIAHKGGSIARSRVVVRADSGATATQTTRGGTISDSSIEVT